MIDQLNLNALIDDIERFLHNDDPEFNIHRLIDMEITCLRLLGIARANQRQGESSEFYVKSAKLLNSVADTILDCEAFSKHCREIRREVELVFKLTERSQEIERIEGLSIHNSSSVCEALRKLCIDSKYHQIGGDTFCDLENEWRMLGKNRVGLHPNSEGENPLNIFASSVLEGEYPPPEVLLAIAYSFESYFDSEGDRSLDEVFFGRKHKKMYSVAFKERYTDYEIFHDQVVTGKIESLEATYTAERLSLTQLAEIYLAKNDDDISNTIDLESFLRGYRRWRKDRTN